MQERRPRNVTGGDQAICTSRSREALSSEIRQSLQIIRQVYSGGSPTPRQVPSEHETPTMGGHGPTLELNDGTRLTCWNYR